MCSSDLRESLLFTVPASRTHACTTQHVLHHIHCWNKHTKLGIIKTSITHYIYIKRFGNSKFLTARFTILYSQSTFNFFALCPLSLQQMTDTKLMIKYLPSILQMVNGNRSKMQTNIRKTSSYQTSSVC